MTSFLLPRLLVILLVSSLLSGCFYRQMSQAPIATTYPYSVQQRMQAAHHWDVLADHEADGILHSERLRGKTYYLPEAGATQDGDFLQGYRSLLKSRLVSRGARVTVSPALGAHLHVDVQVVDHRDRGFIRPPHGALTILATGIAVATIPINRWSEPALALIPAAAAADLVSGSWTHTGNTEIIVTTQVIENEHVIYSSSNIYYINGGDRRHYGARPAPVVTPTIRVTDEW